MAEELQIRLLVEPEPDLLIENSTQFLNFIKKFDSKYIGLNFDIGHFFCVHEDPSKLIIELQEYIHHIHLEDIDSSRKHFHLIPGLGDIDFIALYQALREVKYNGFLTAELYTYNKNPEQAGKDAYIHLRNLVN